MQLQEGTWYAIWFYNGKLCDCGGKGCGIYAFDGKYKKNQYHRDAKGNFV